MTHMKRNKAEKVVKTCFVSFFSFSQPESVLVCLAGEFKFTVFVILGLFGCLVVAEYLHWVGWSFLGYVAGDVTFQFI